MLKRLRRLSRRIGGWMPAKKAETALGGTSKKPSKTPSPMKKEANGPASKLKDAKASAKPSAKAGVGAKAKPVSKAPPSKPMAKAGAAKAAVKVSAKVAVKAPAKVAAKAPEKQDKVAAKPEPKPAAKAGAAKAAVKVSAKVAVKAPAKVPAKAPEKQDKVTAKVAAKPAANAAKVAAGVVAEPGKKPAEMDIVADLDSEFDTTDIVDADLESAADIESVEALNQDPSAARRAAMSLKGPAEAEKVAQEKKKKKDDLKIDRNGDIEAQWAALKEKTKVIKPVPYKMTERYEARGPLQHKVLGWGYILSNQNDRLEVLFQEGIKFLISNYKA